jgi:lipoprotein-anchoring transpeptidase ErfK/SrfK
VDPYLTIVAKAEVPNLAVYANPGDATPAQTLPNPRPLGGPLVLVVTKQQAGWLHAELPVRPNGSTGWIKASDVSLTHHDYRIVVSLGQHQIWVYQGSTLLDNEPIGVGTGATPTPGGAYFTADFVQITQAGSPYGPYAYGLSGFSDVLTSFGGGPGQLAIHGTNDPSGLGQDVSHGCIRMSNAGITKLAGILPIGVPVTVEA